MSNIGAMHATLTLLESVIASAQEYRHCWRCIVGETDSKFSEAEIERMLCNLERYRARMWRALDRLEESDANSRP